MSRFFYLVLFLAASLLKSGQSCTVYKGGENVRVNLHSRHSRDLSTNCGEGSEAPPNRVDTTRQLRDLRSEMEDENLDAYIIPLDGEGRRTFISGFSGSNGDAIVSKSNASCWTDGRYFLQASQQLDCNWNLEKMGQPDVPTYTEWLIQNLANGSVVGADPTLTGAQTWLEMKKDLKDAAGITLKSIEDNLVDRIWYNKPESTPKDVVIHPMEIAGKDFKEKIADLRASLIEDNYHAMVVTELDEIAWLLNLRGEGGSNDEGLMNSPFFDSLVLVTLNEATLYGNLDKINETVRSYLGSPCGSSITCVTVKDIEIVMDDLKAWAKKLEENEIVLITDASTYDIGASFAVYEAVEADRDGLLKRRSKFDDSPLIYPKASKNAAESEGMIKAHLRDAFACVEFGFFMEQQIKVGGADNWTELDAAETLRQMREKQQGFKGISFTTIAASGSNGAVIHYTPTPETNAKINSSSVFLVDSGAQYEDGTTDITRTYFFGPNPERELIERYTMVLMGAIDLARAVVPLNTAATSVDYAARQHLFQAGLDYRHGTGHGIGAYGGVHENPINLGMSSTNAGKIGENFFFSDEPGYYRDGYYGIRLESIVRSVKVDFDNAENVYGEFIGFETVTLVPFEQKLIDFSMMNAKQIEWYNNYNEEIMLKVAPHFNSIARYDIYEWLMNKCKKVEPYYNNATNLYIHYAVILTSVILALY